MINLTATHAELFELEREKLVLIDAGRFGQFGRDHRAVVVEEAERLRELLRAELA